MTFSVNFRKIHNLSFLTNHPYHHLVRDLCKKLKHAAFSIFTKNLTELGEKHRKILRAKGKAQCSVPYGNLYSNAYQNLSSI